MKSLTTVLSLVLVLVYSQADGQGCDKTLGLEELQQLDGDWVLVWSFWNKVKADEILPNATSDHIELRLQSDRRTLVALERATYSGGKCAIYTYNMTLSQTQEPEGHNHLDLVGLEENRDGEVKVYNDKSTAEFYPSSPNTMKMFFKNNKYGDILLIYRREGQHLNDLEQDHEANRALAKCLNLQGENYKEWNYDGADFCHKPSALPTLDSDELHQVDGDWVMVLMAYDKIKSQNYPVGNLSSSHMAISVQPDKHTLAIQDRSIMGGKCYSYTANLVLPQTSEKIHRLNMENAMENIDGVEKPYEDTATAEFFNSSDSTMEMFYKSNKNGYFLVFYRREGQHLDDLERDQEKFRERAKYLGMTGENFGEWRYDGAADFCHKKSALPTLGSDELQQVDGDWVLVFMAYDKVKSQDDAALNFSSSHMKISVQPDRHTLAIHEHNMVGTSCVSYTANLVLPQENQKINRLNMQDGRELIDGVEKPYNDVATAEFFFSPENTMEMFYKSNSHGPFLLKYKREGHHREVTAQEKEQYRAKAKYLGLTGKDFEEWHYDGTSDFCHKKSAPAS